MVKLQLKNIHPDCMKRLSVNETQKRFNAFLYNEKEDTIQSLKELSVEISRNKKSVDKKLKRDIKQTATLSKKLIESKGLR